MKKLLKSTLFLMVLTFSLNSVYGSYAVITRSDCKINYQLEFSFDETIADSLGLEKIKTIENLALLAAKEKLSEKGYHVVDEESNLLFNHVLDLSHKEGSLLRLRRSRNLCSELGELHDRSIHASLYEISLEQLSAGSRDITCAKTSAIDLIPNCKIKK